MEKVSLVLFRDGDRASLDAVAIVRDIVHGGRGDYSLTEIDVADRPALATQYNVRTTPTILLMQNGDIVDRIIGTPTPSLLHDLLDTRTHTPPAWSC